MAATVLVKQLVTKGRVTESFCSALDLPSHQQRAAVAAMATMNLDRFGRQKRLRKSRAGND